MGKSKDLFGGLIAVECHCLESFNTGICKHCFRAKHLIKCEFIERLVFKS